MKLRRIRLTRLLPGLAIALLLAQSALALHPKHAPDLPAPSASASEFVNVIIRTRPETGSRFVQSVTTRLGGTHLRSLPLIRSEVVRVRTADLETLANEPDVEFISLDHTVQATKYAAGPDYGWMLSLGATAPYTTLAFDGTGIGVAVLDTGILATSTDLGTRVVYSKSFVTGNTNASDAAGHGTMVAGLVAGSGANSNTKHTSYWIRGIAPNANLVNLKVLGDTASGLDSDVIAGISAAIQLQAKYNIRVINLSLGRPVTQSCSTDPLCCAFLRIRSPFLRETDHDSCANPITILV